MIIMIILNFGILIKVFTKKNKTAGNINKKLTIETIVYDFLLS